MEIEIKIDILPVSRYNTSGGSSESNHVIKTTSLEKRSMTISEIDTTGDTAPTAEPASRRVTTRVNPVGSFVRRPRVPVGPTVELESNVLSRHRRPDHGARFVGEKTKK